MPKRKLEKIEFFAGNNGLADIDVGTSAERARRIVRRVPELQAIREARRLEKAEENKEKNARRREIYAQRQAAQGIVPRQPRGPYVYKRGPNGKQIDYVLKAKVLGAVYKYVGHYGRMTPWQRRQSREKKAQPLSIRAAGDLAQIGYKRARNWFMYYQTHGYRLRRPQDPRP